MILDLVRVAGSATRVAGITVSNDIKQLFLAYRRELTGYLANKLRDADAAADIAQDAFLRLAEQQQRPGGLAVTHARSYLFRTARNLAIDHVRRSQRNPVQLAEDDQWLDLPEHRPDSDHGLTMRRELEQVRAALAELPERTRQVFLLTRVEGRTYPEAARILGISDSSVQKHLARAIAHVMSRRR